jgi:hypothetical protein
VTRRRFIVRPSEHPAVSFAVARRVQQALADQPRHIAVTAAKLTSEIVEDLRRKRLDRLATSWGEDPGLNRIWFELVVEAGSGRLRGAA